MLGLLESQTRRYKLIPCTDMQQNVSSYLLVSVDSSQEFFSWLLPTVLCDKTCSVVRQYAGH